MKLSSEARAKLRNSAFAGPHRSFPVTDKIHAEKALQFVGRSEEKGHITPEEAAHIRHVAHAYLAAHHAQNGGEE